MQDNDVSKICNGTSLLEPVLETSCESDNRLNVLRMTHNLNAARETTVGLSMSIET